MSCPHRHCHSIRRCRTCRSINRGRPIEEVARELGLPAGDIIKLASNENPLGPSPAALAAMQKVLANLHLYPDGNAFYLKRQARGKTWVEARKT